MPDHFGWMRVNSAPAATVGWSNPVQIAIVGGPKVSGDELRVVAQNPTGALSAINDTCLSFNATPDVLILNVIAGNTGDANCDGTIGPLDIPSYVLALVDPAGYAGQYAGCNDFKADMNHDGVVDSRDIRAFVQRLLSP